MKINKLKLGSEIKKIRRALDITQKELSNKTGLSVTYLSLLENGKRGIGIDRLNALAEIFGIPAELFIILASNDSDKRNKDANELLEQIKLITRQAIGLYISL